MEKPLKMCLPVHPGEASVLLGAFIFISIKPYPEEKLQLHKCCVILEVEFEGRGVGGNAMTLER
jgi:hypothetical protein